MKVAILSDFHLGFAEGRERSEECFEQASQALQLALESKAELIIHAGDLFDDDVPSQETWEKTFKVFAPLKKAKASSPVVKEKEGRRQEFNFSHVPMVAIHGTHECRGRDFKNALEVLESAGVLVHLHAATAAIGDLVVHGLSGIPEKKALDALKLWNPKPLPGKKNVLVLHQSLKDFLPFDDEMIASISLADLPSGFDLIVNGHLHWSDEQDLNGKKFILPGSTVMTQMKKLESERQKGIFLWDSESGSTEFKVLPNQRKFFYKKLEFKEAGLEQVLGVIEKELSLLLSESFEQKPVVKIKLKGTLAKGLKQSDLSLKPIIDKFGKKAIVAIDRNFTDVSFAKKLEELRVLQKSKKSITALGLELLEKNLAQTSFKNAFDPREFFELLSAGKVDEVVERLSGSQKV